MSKGENKIIHVAVVAPGFAPSAEVLKKIKTFAADSVDFKFHLPAKLIEENPMFANREDRRARHLMQALESDVYDIVWCLRGGYGSLPLLDYLKKIPKPKKYKCLVGLSDITSLHLFLKNTWGWSSIHGSNLDRWVLDQIPNTVLKELLSILKGKSTQTIFKNIKPINELAKKAKSIKGVLTGGNLVTLTSHLGTRHPPKLRGSLLFLEEIGERGYKIDRCLTQLRLSGALSGCRGVVFGQFTGCKEPDGSLLWPWVLKEWAKKIGIPVFTGVPSGHDSHQWPLSFGTSAEVKKVNDRCQLIIKNRTS